jgi:steroid 5-alpha reductase family enzyme
MSALWVSLTTLNAVTLIINNHNTTYDYFFFFGISLWISGFIFELISDEQKRRFKKDVKNKDLFITSGLWSISRHPNYFGEIVIWIGVFVMSIPALHGIQFLSILSPIFVYFLLTRISGVNLLEESADLKWGNLEDYKLYKKNTSILFPYKI